MAGCATCLHKNVHPNACSDCLSGTHFKPRIKTNADRIRSMSDEELAEWLTALEIKAYSRIGYFGNEKRFKSQYIEWLKSPWEEVADEHTD